jgi:pimeloyl-ACP methyl ester carboxylesterase
MTATISAAGDLWVHQQGHGPDVLLIAGLGDPLEAWQFQVDELADRYRITAYDNRGTGRSPLRAGERLSVPSMAEDAAAVLRAHVGDPAHVAGFSGGSVIAQELALRHPELVRSLVLVSAWDEPDEYFRAVLNSWRWMIAAAPSEQAFLDAFLVWVYTARAHADGTVAQIIEEALAFPHKPSVEAIQQTIDALLAHSTADRLHRISVPTLVLAGQEDITTPARYGRAVAAGIPGAQLEVLACEAHQPFQEASEQFNARLDAFWREVDGRR